MSAVFLPIEGHQAWGQKSGKDTRKSIKNIQFSYQCVVHHVFLFQSRDKLEEKILI